jgi:hypothetical protein
MATTVQLDRGRAPVAPAVDRRDPTTRAMRNAVAAWFRIHPATLAALDRGTVERMAERLEGRRPHRALDAREGICPISDLRHPWAG